MIRLQLVFAAIAITWSAGLAAAVAEGCEADVARALGADRYEFALACWGTGRDTGALVIEFGEGTPDTKQIAERVTNVRNALERLRRETETRPVLGRQPLMDYLGKRLELLDAAGEDGEAQIAALRGLFADNAYEIIGNDGGRVRLLGQRLYYAGGGDGVEKPLDEHCRGQRSACVAYRERVASVRILRLIERLAGYAYNDALVAHYEDSKLAGAKWQAYFEDTRHQWFWEYWWNGRRMLDGDACRREATRVGFCEVPDDQVILLHPDVAFIWDDGAGESSSLRAVPVVELYGRNQWQWGADGSVHKAWGWSVIAAYNEVADGRDWGFGLMYHHRNRFSLGVTSTEGEVGVLLSVDLGDKLFTRKARYRRHLENIDRRNFREVLFDGD